MAANDYRYLQLDVKGSKVKGGDIALNGNPISELRSITCHMGSHSVTCHSTLVNALSKSSRKCQNCRIGLLMIMIMFLRHSKLHMPDICGICSIYAPPISPDSAYFPAYFTSKSSASFKKILCYEPASLPNRPHYMFCLSTCLSVCHVHSDESRILVDWVANTSLLAKSLGW